MLCDDCDGKYDRVDLWIDPQLADLMSPDATVSEVQSISRIQWVGISTGLKTEPTDQIHVSHLLIGHTWKSVLDDAAALIAAPEDRGHTGPVWDETVDFKRDVYPLLKSRCFKCHAGAKPNSGYRLDVYREFLGYSSGEVLAEPGRSRDSRFIKADSADQRMPNATCFRSGTSQWQRHGASRPARGDQFSSKKPGGLRHTAANKKPLPAKVGGIERMPPSEAYPSGDQ